MSPGSWQCDDDNATKAPLCRLAVMQQSKKKKQHTAFWVMLHASSTHPADVSLNSVVHFEIIQKEMADGDGILLGFVQLTVMPQI